MFKEVFKLESIMNLSRWALVIFVLVAGISAFSFRYTKTFEQVK